VIDARKSATLLVALAVLNCGLTFHNVWPTLGITWRGELSVELAMVLVVLAAITAMWGRVSSRVLTVLSALFVLFAIGRYGEVTAPALYGREVNLYWDLQHVASVTGMLTRVAPTWIIVAGGAGLAGALALLYFAARWSFGRVARSLQARGAQLAFGAAGAVLIAWFAVQRLNESMPRVPKFSTPVSNTYAVQATKMFETYAARHGSTSLPASPVLASKLSALDGSDVLVVFLESYGSVTYDRAEFLSALAPSRERLNAAIRETGRGVVSTFAGSPTFGGSSWFAHLSFMSGIEVGDPVRYALLMTQKRETLVSVFTKAGYRTVAAMPGLRQNWPEGGFYGFDDIYGAERLDYRGPAFGWWRIPDQFAFAKLDALEIEPRPRTPVFAMLTTITTHMPFTPTPPLQENWSRVLTAQPYDAEPLRESLARQPEWTNMGKDYVSTIGYTLDTIAAYLRARKDDNFVMIVLGDHQPAANVSGEGASWDVPVHVIAGRPEILEALRMSGFAAGLTPNRQHPVRISELAPVMLHAFTRTTATKAVGAD